MQGTVVLADDRMVRRLNARAPRQEQAHQCADLRAPGAGGVLALGVVRPKRGAGRAARRITWRIWSCMRRLHLQGHDHDHPGDARRMEMAESRILRGIGVPNPGSAA